MNSIRALPCIALLMGLISFESIYASPSTIVRFTDFTINVIDLDLTDAQSANVAVISSDPTQINLITAVGGFQQFPFSTLGVNQYVSRTDSTQQVAGTIFFGDPFVADSGAGAEAFAESDNLWAAADVYPFTGNIIITPHTRIVLSANASVSVLAAPGGYESGIGIAQLFISDDANQLGDFSSFSVQSSNQGSEAGTGRIEVSLDNVTDTSLSGRMYAMASAGAYAAPQLVPEPNSAGLVITAIAVGTLIIRLGRRKESQSGSHR